MSETTAELKREIQKTYGLMQTLRDEVRVRIHLGGMDALDEWNKLEPHVLELEDKASELTEATRSALAKVVERLSKLRSSLG